MLNKFLNLFRLNSINNFFKIFILDFRIYDTVSFYRATRMDSADYAVARCLCDVYVGGKVRVAKL